MNEPSYPPSYPHDAVVQIADDVFMVRGSMRMNALMRITRNMAIVRHDNELSLINPIRLSAAGERELTSLGKVKRIIRLGPFHGMDDPYYVGQFKTELWCQPGGKSYRQPPIDVELSAGCDLPFPDAELIPFEGTKQPESVLHLSRGKGLILTCDAIQHYGDYRHNNWLARIVMPFIGFEKTTLVGPIWLKYLAADSAVLETAFRRLLSYEFDALLAAHGSFLARGANDAVRAAIDRAFQNK